MKIAKPQLEQQLEQILAPLIGRGKIAKWPQSKFKERMTRVVNAASRVYINDPDAREKIVLIGRVLTMGWVGRKSNQEIFDKIERLLMVRSFRRSPLVLAVNSLTTTGEDNV